MVFYDKPEGGVLKPEEGTVEQRSRTLLGINGLFFTLMVLRTAIPLEVASTFLVSTCPRGKVRSPIAQ